jgi:hypothetical protein
MGQVTEGGWHPGTLTLSPAARIEVADDPGRRDRLRCTDRDCPSCRVHLEPVPRHEELADVSAIRDSLVNCRSLDVGGAGPWSPSRWCPLPA